MKKQEKSFVSFWVLLLLHITLSECQIWNHVVAHVMLLMLGLSLQPIKSSMAAPSLNWWDVDKRFTVINGVFKSSIKLHWFTNKTISCTNPSITLLYSIIVKYNYRCIGTKLQTKYGRFSTHMAHWMRCVTIFCASSSLH